MVGRLASRIAFAMRLWRAEGAQSLLERLRDRRLDARRAAAFTPASGAPAAEVPAATAELLLTLWVLPFPLQRRRGGAAIQLLVRLEERAAVEPVALLQRLPDRWRCELWGAGVARALVREWPLADAAPLELEGSPIEILLASARWTRARRLHFESLVDLPLTWPLAAVEHGLEFGCSAHDFALFCPRPHLLEEPSGRFCGFSTDPIRCAQCLAVDRRLPAGFQEQRRSLAARLLQAADSVEFPSAYMRREHLRLFPALDPARTRIVPPRSLAGSVLPRTVRRPPKRIAYAGAVHRHKGAVEFEAVVRQLAELRPKAYDWHVFGGGDAALLRRLRRLPRTRVHGYYGAGSLPQRLVAAQIDLVLLLSTWPEAHCLVLDEAASAGVPVVAFDIGALGERVAESGWGDLVEMRLGAEGVASYIADLG